MARTRNRSGTAHEINTIQSVERAIKILEYLCRGPASLSELSRELGLHKSTAFGLLQTLIKHNYVHQEIKTGRYRLGYRVLALGGAFLEHCDLREIASPYLQQLVNEHGETVHLVVMDDGQVVYVDKIDSPQSIRMVSRIGRRLPAHCTGVGKAILAYLPEEKVQAIVKKRGLPRFTANTITTWEELSAELARIREEGVSYDREEIEEGLRCVAAPLIGYGQYPVGAISVSGPASRMTEEKMSRIAGSLKKVAGEISQQMGADVELNGYSKI
ncbi:IclR family transcriptional regulator [Desulfofundulus thermosubterraneus]|uniref:Glycerol operon regulatory protein n=1 Tax=Desulfofundulus thermosubterraneus DSM 16057 TaxID=1121432 RepID=A0A1M6F9U2_9FIRM|nr:IclR family transcriptional regulator [Desulfofundulus thermosubterraneus]SHI94445.1 transcriptional regulator, IclR family [Desulfofundulus thermosubterraneus DSM 16057]